LSDWHHAEDVLVETFTKLAHSSLKEKGSLKGWLYRVATNQCYKLLRKAKREVGFSEETFRQQINNPIPRVHEERKIQKLLSELPDNQRVVVVLKFYDGMKYQEIADILHCPLGTVKSRMHEGIKHIKRVMEKRK